MVTLLRMEYSLLGKCEILLLLLGNRLILINTGVRPTLLILVIRLARNVCMFPLILILGVILILAPRR